MYTTQSISAATADLFTQTKRIVDNISFSSIHVLPRSDNDSADCDSAKVENVNLSPKTLCNQTNVKYIDN